MDPGQFLVATPRSNGRQPAPYGVDGRQLPYSRAPRVPHHARREGWQGYNGAVYPRRAGSVFFFDAFESHDNFQPEWASDEDQLWVILLPQHTIIKTWAIRNGRIEPRSVWKRVFTAEELGVGLEALRLITLDTPYLPPKLMRMQMTAFLSLLLGAAAHNGFCAERREEHEGLQHRTVDAIRQHIEATAGNGVTLDSLVPLTGYSKYYFARLFKKHTGLTIHSYIDQCRLQRVRQMRADGQNQKAIAYALGFSSPAAFAHWLRHCRECG